MSNDTAVDFDTDMQTIRDYVAAVVETKARIATAYSGALEQVQLVMQSASPAEATPDMVGVMLKSGLKAIEKASLQEVKSAIGADLGPLADLLHGIADEIERASKAAANAAAASWILELRSWIVNTYTQGQTGEDLRQQIEDEYKRNDEGGRGGYIAGIENELAALRQMRQSDDAGAGKSTLVPTTEQIELRMYESWINQNFNGDCMDGTGFIKLEFASDGTAASAKVLAPLGDRVGARLNAIMARAGVPQLMSLDVVKQVCREDGSMCFEGNNAVRKAALDDDAGNFLAAPGNWTVFKAFTP